MFDSATREATWVGDAAMQADTDEQTITAKIHELESNESTVAQAQDALQSCQKTRCPILGPCSCSRPAERHLEEAAQLLEEAGQYERADVRPRVGAGHPPRRAGSSKCSVPPVSLPSTLIYGSPPVAELAAELFCGPAWSMGEVGPRSALFIRFLTILPHCRARILKALAPAARARPASD